jgi:hypothetical protein
VVNAKELTRLKGHQGEVTALAFAPDGKTLVSGSADFTLLVWDVSHLDKPAPMLELPPKKLDALWTDLAAVDARNAFQAIHVLARASKQSVPFLNDHLKPATLDPQRIAKLVADLDSEQFKTRKNAGDDLEKLGELAEPALRKALEGNPTLEIKKRIEPMLEKIAAQVLSSEQVRGIRGVEVLELAGTPEAKQVLEALAKGAPGARLTQEAKASLERLATGQ